MGNARRAEVSHELFVPSGGGQLFSEPELRGEFTALVLDYTPRQLAKFSGATPEGARHWLDGSRCANLANAVNIARSIPAVADWIVQKIGYRAREAQAQSYDVWLRGLYAIAAGDTPDALKARWAIRRLTVRDDDEDRNEPDTKTISFINRLEQRRRP